MRRTRPFLFDRSTQGAAVSRRWRRGCAAGLVALAAAFATVQSADAQQCQRAVNVIRPTAVFSHPANSFNLASGWWAAAGLMDTLLRWKIEPEVVYGNETALQP